jgi:Putative auto-transporter adhesin, head GIN domain
MGVRSAAGFAAAGVLTLAGCFVGGTGGGVAGSGSVTVEERSVPAFSAIEVSHGIRLELVQGTPARVAVRAQANIQKVVTTEVSGGTLTVDATRSYVTSDGVTVSVTAPEVRDLRLSGGAHGSASKIDVPSLTVSVSGGAILTLSGRSDAFDLSASGGAIVEAGDLASTDASVDLSGGVKATVSATGSVRGQASGGVVLTLRGSPQVVDVTTSGGAVVTRP